MCPAWHVIPSLLKKYGGSAKTISTDDGANFLRTEKVSLKKSISVSVQ
jgi:hypothetical protein